MLRRGDLGAAQRIATGVDHLLSHHFAGCPRGAWIDQFDAQGLPCVDKIPASSLYHVMMAYGELETLELPAHPEGEF